MKKPLSVLGLIFACSLTGLADSIDAKTVIHRIVRSAGSSKVMVRKIDVNRQESSQEVMQWISQNRGSLERTTGGPFDATKQYVSTHAGQNIYVHVLDWAGKNNLSIPAVIDRPILKVSLFGGPPISVGSMDQYPRVDQYPWGTLIVVPEEQRLNDIDTIVVLQLAGDPGELVQPRIVEEDSTRGILLQGDSAKLQEGLLHNQGPDWIENWKDLRDFLTWRVRVPAAGDYSLAMTYSCAPGCGGAKFEISAGKGKVMGTLSETTGVFGDWMNFEKRDVDGTLHLKRGVNQITLRAISKSKTEEILRLYGLYLLTQKQKAALAAAAQRARKERAPTDWFRAAKYGIMVHWIAATQPRSGPPKPFCDAVRDFDVLRFADTVKEIGAEYLIFTLAHGIQKFPAPLKSVDAVLPGRTCTRDLPADLADALAQRGIRLILYYHHGVGDPQWSRASGFLSKDKSAFFEHEAAILREVGLRYGSKLAGWWFDDRYPLQPFEELYKATKAGNPDRIVAWNSWILPRSTDFQEYWAAELGGGLLRLPEKGYFEDDGPQSGLQPQALIFVDDPWMHGYPDTEIHAPLFSDEVLAAYIADCNKKGAPVTMNIGVYQDGTVSPATMRQLQTIRKTLRGD